MYSTCWTKALKFIFPNGLAVKLPGGDSATCLSFETTELSVCISTSTLTTQETIAHGLDGEKIVDGDISMHADFYAYRNRCSRCQSRLAPFLRVVSNTLPRFSHAGLLAAWIRATAKSKCPIYHHRRCGEIKRRGKFS